ncbi:MAG: HAD family phosphatase [Bryobacterales bacterium]|nr:HAD family phosphatase [Bryobacterales bacterium]
MAGSRDAGFMMDGPGRVAPGLALLFDMDGVLIHSNPLHRTAWKLYNQRQGVETSEAMLEFMYGRRNDEIVRHFLGQALSPEEVAAHGEAKERLYRQLMEGRVGEYLVPGVRSFIESRPNVPMALATNAEPANVQFLLRASGLADRFQVVVHGGLVRNPKPDPEIFLRAAALLGVEARNSIVFEDSYAGVRAARNAGMRVVGVRTTHPSLPDADLSVDDFLSPELTAWLGEQKPVN